MEAPPTAAPRYRLRFRTAKDLFDGMPMAASDMRAQPTGEDCIGFMRKLADGETPEEAITFAAYLLPPREAVWWAHQSLSYVPEALNDLDRQMIELAEAWVREPDEEMRDTVLQAARAAEAESPGVWLGFGVGWSGATMGPLDGSPVPPPSYLTPRAINAAVLGLLARIETDHRDAMLKGFVEMAVKLTEA